MGLYIRVYMSLTTCTSTDIVTFQYRRQVYKTHVLELKQVILLYDMKARTYHTYQTTLYDETK